MKTKKQRTVIIKTIVLLFSVGFIGYKLYGQFANHGIVLLNGTQTVEQLVWLVPVVLLMPLNWGMEAKKWESLVNHLEQTSFNRAYRAVLAGVTVSLFTPNRVGEFGGRILALERKNRVQGIFASLLGSFSQLLITLLMGLMLLPFYLYWQPDNLQELFSTFTFFFVTGVVIILALAVYFNTAKIILWMKRKLKYRKMLRFISFVSGYSKKELFRIFLLSFLRYLVFGLQFMFILRFFNVQIPFGQMFTGIALVYLILAVVPTVALTEVGVRGSVALFILGAFTPLTAQIVMSTALLWIINLALPALVGAFCIIRFKI